LHRYQHELRHIATCQIKDIQPHTQSSAKVAGIILNLRTRQTKRGNRIAIFSLDDSTTQIEVVCFSECYQKNRTLIVEDNVVIVEGDVSIDNFNHTARIVARDLYTLDDARRRNVKYLRIHVNNELTFDPNHIRFALTKHLGGTCPVQIQYIKDNIKANIILGGKWQVKPTENVLQSLQTELSMDEVEFIYE
jgi:DNA polymerase III subunit alpha